MHHGVESRPLRQPRLIALVGSPNSGKTSIYNWLTGSRFKTVNYPGATVDCQVGTVAAHFSSAPLQFMDTPGVYSLTPQSPDEEVTHRAVFGQTSFNANLIGAILIVDATQLNRQLLLVNHFKQTGFPFVVALTMTDILTKNQMRVQQDLLSQLIGAPVFAVEGRLGGGVRELVDFLKDWEPSSSAVAVPRRLSASEKFDLQAQVDQIVQQVFTQKNPRGDVLHNTLSLDRLLLHQVFGVFIFVVIMGFLFTSVFFLATPLMDAIDWGFSQLSQSILNLGADNPWIDFVGRGLIPSFGAVLVFVPQICILFLAIGVLEDSGYLARVAALIDRPFARLGMSGRSFVPILSGFACAVPAMMATRHISSWRERWIVLSVLPLMTCSARLPVYALLLTFLFRGESAWKPGLTLAGVYVLSLCVGGAAAWVLNSILKNQQRTVLMMELPIYRWPQWRWIIKSAVLKTKAYAVRAGPVIVVLALMLWGLSSFPRLEGHPPDLDQSYSGQIGHWIEPVFRPMGLDWRVGVSLLSAFSAREVFVSSLAVVMNLGTDVQSDSGLRDGLIAKMAAATFPDGTPLFTVASVCGLIVFFMFALQCMSTVAMAYREWKSWKAAVWQLLILNLVAYVTAVAVVQGLRWVGVG